MTQTWSSEVLNIQTELGKRLTICRMASHFIFMAFYEPLKKNMIHFPEQQLAQEVIFIRIHFAAKNKMNLTYHRAYWQVILIALFASYLCLLCTLNQMVSLKHRGLFFLHIPPLPLNNFVNLEYCQIFVFVTRFISQYFFSSSVYKINLFYLLMATKNLNVSIITSYDCLFTK